jgi:hypothetical protein
MAVVVTVSSALVVAGASTVADVGDVTTPVSACAPSTASNAPVPVTALTDATSVMGSWALAVPLVAVAWSVFRSTRYAYCFPSLTDVSVNEVADGLSDDPTVVTVEKPSVDRSTSIPPSKESSLLVHETVISDELESADTFDGDGSSVVAVTSPDSFVAIYDTLSTR